MFILSYLTTYFYLYRNNREGAYLQQIYTADPVYRRGLIYHHNMGKRDYHFRKNKQLDFNLLYTHLRRTVIVIHMQITEKLRRTALRAS